MSDVAYKIGHTYYRLAEAMGLVAEGDLPWKIVPGRVLAETRREVTVEFPDGIRTPPKPWVAYVSPWDAVDAALDGLEQDRLAALRQLDKVMAAAWARVEGIARERARLQTFRGRLLESGEYFY